MGIRMRLGWAVAMASAIVASVPHDARAQDDSAANTAAARRLGSEGFSLADAGKCEEAVDLLRRSEEMHHAVSVLERLGECQVRLGKLVEGTENLRRALREQLPPGASPVFIDAQRRAQRLLAEARPKIARLKVAVTAPTDAEVWVTIDGVNEPAANLNTDRLVDPGDHLVRAGAAGYLNAESKVHLDEGGVGSLTLTLQPAQTPAQPASVQTPVPSARDHTLAYIAGGVGIVWVGIGAAFGVAAMNDKSSLDSSCQNHVCPGSAQSTYDSGTRFGTISTVGFVIGGVGLAAGAVLYFWDFSGHGQGERGAASPTARAWVGPSGAGLSGSF
jgi:hypothetical protein